VKKRPVIISLNLHVCNFLPGCVSDNFALLMFELLCPRGYHLHHTCMQEHGYICSEAQSHDSDMGENVATKFMQIQNPAAAIE
jgi:hypothetical protein